MHIFEFAFLLINYLVSPIYVTFQQLYSTIDIKQFSVMNKQVYITFQQYIFFTKRTYFGLNKLHMLSTKCILRLNSVVGTK